MRADEPALPPGLSPQQAEEPALPSGLAPAEPATPSQPHSTPVFSPTGESAVHPNWRRQLPFTLTGFIEVGQGGRTQRDANQKRQSLGESRLHLDMQRHTSWATFTLATDFVADWVDTDRTIDLETGQGWIDLREANVEFSPLSFLDIKFGRQILTWGTGDLVFVNDLFPKDWKAFLIGREESYLKAPSDALKVSLFSSWANLDIVYTPAFDADRFIDGRRLSYWDPLVRQRVGRNAVRIADRPNKWLRDAEWALRLSRRLGGHELALYGFYGFWKSPGGFDTRGQVTFPRLAVYGASLRGPLGRGIANGEVGYYDSLADRTGGDPFIRNSEFRLLAGYEQEVETNFTAGIQYALEHMIHHTRFRRTLPDQQPMMDEARHFVTIRLTKLLWQQNLVLSLFTFYSPSDQDVYLRPWVLYKLTDVWSVTLGANIFVGKDTHTFFGQFAKNTNVYIRIRYGF